MIERILLFFLLLFFSIEGSSFHYNGVISCYIRPYRGALEDEFRALKSTPQKGEGVTDPIVIKKEDVPIQNEGDGLALYLIGQRADNTNISYRLAKQILKRTLTGVDGVVAYYKGYSTITDKNGRIFFARQEQQRKLPVVITLDISPVIVSGSVPHHFRVTDVSHAQWYECAGEESEDGLSITWSAKKCPAPAEGRIAENSLIIISDPTMIFFDETPRTVAYSENFILPDMFVYQNFTRGVYALYALEALRYHNHLQFSKKESTYQTNIHYAEKARY